MTIARGRTFKNGNSEAIRLPKEIGFGENVELVLVRSGDVVTLYPAKMSLREMAARLKALPVPGSVEERDETALPERSGL